MTDAPTVAFQGEPGAYSEAAALAFFGPQAQTCPRATFEEIFTAVERGECTHAMVPIENSVAGSIHRNYDLLLEHSLHIVGEYFLRVQHCLIALPGARLGEIRTVISHPQALAQCRHYLRGLSDVRTEAVFDTAGSVRMVREQGDPTVAAIAARRAAEVHGMTVLAEGIEDNPANYTRFLVLAGEPVTPKPPAKTSIVFALRNVPGALFRALSAFALRDIDLTKIESRPRIGHPWEYLFYLDFAGHSEEEVSRRALDHLQEMTLFFRLLGSYPRHLWQREEKEQR